MFKLQKNSTVSLQDVIRKLLAPVRKVFTYGFTVEQFKFVKENVQLLMARVNTTAFIDTPPELSERGTRLCVKNLPTIKQ
ncbi:hypothetical protein KIN20_029781 [Parelaphostrongylus tenuis]|uniref:Uncharacterized protein n=1 Tax=Parelaphostrongylus tenuis TaxID=148309 RepID=A0AAD5R2Z8_PARTN|nr:hypothetical protein KIN20_029781 [Parelaphostrongylus tenuis]